MYTCDVEEFIIRIADGLSIPFFSLGRNVSRTLSRVDASDWLLSVNAPRGAAPPNLPASQVGSEVGAAYDTGIASGCSPRTGILSTNREYAPDLNIAESSAPPPAQVGCHL